MLLNISILNTCFVVVVFLFAFSIQIIQNIKESQVLQKYVSSSITVIFKCIIFPKIFVFKQIDASLLTIRDFYQKHEFLNMPSFWHLFGRSGCRVDEKKSQKAENRLQLA